MVEGRPLLHVIPFVQDFMENMEGSENGEILIFAQRYLVERVKNENKVHPLVILPTFFLAPISSFHCLIDHFFLFLPSL